MDPSVPLEPFLIERMLDLAVAIQQIPAPTFREAPRAAFIRQRFHAEHLKDVTQDSLGNVYARFPGKGKAAPLVISAHLDTVFPQETDLSLTRSQGKIAGPGIGDNSLGLAALLGLVWVLRREKTPTSTLPGDLWLVANVCEEGLGNLAGMRAVVDRFADHARGYLILEGMALGQIYHRGLGVQRYQINAETEGGHSWVDYGKASAVHELAVLINRLAAIPLAKHPRTTLNVGMVSGGTSVNTIAAQACCLVDLRSEEPDALEELSSLVETMIQEANRPTVRVTGEVVGHRPTGSLPLSHPMVRLAINCLELNGIQPRPNIGSTDANLPLSRGLPAICLGLTTGAGAHTTHEYIETRPLERGMAQLVEFIRRIYSQ